MKGLQALAEAALKLAIAHGSYENISHARNQLGFILINAYDPDINNKQLAHIHIKDSLTGWLEVCQSAIDNMEYSEDSILIQNLNQCLSKYPIDQSSVSNVLDIMFSQGDATFENFKKSELLDLYFYIVGEEHTTTLLNGPAGQNIKDIKNYPQKLQEESDKKKNSRIYLYSCMYMEDHWNIFEIKEVIQCYKELESKEVKKLRTKLSADELDIVFVRLSRLKKIKEEKVSLNNNYNINDYFFNLYQRLDDKNVDEEKEATLVTEGKYALVIGNSNYEEKLNTPKNDANDITKTLIKMGYKVSTYLDLSFEDFKAAITRFSLDAKNAKVSIFYYSGHAYQIGGQNFLLPIDTDMKAKEKDAMQISIELNKILRQNIPGNKKIVFLDACRNNPFNKKGLAPINVGENTLVSYAAEAGKYAFDGDRGLSPYAQALVNNLPRDQDIAVILRMVRLDVKKSTLSKQNTSEYSNLIDNDKL